MTAPRSVAAAIVATAALLTATGCQATLDPDREAKPKAAPSATSAPAANPSSTTSPSLSLSPPSLGPDAKVRDRLRAQIRARSARRHAALAARRAAGPVIAISVDGLNPTALTELGPARVPTFFALIHGGASTLNARPSSRAPRRCRTTPGCSPAAPSRVPVVITSTSTWTPAG